ncbi:MAG: hypothetical protein KC502_05945 [Myxococcales bacterium]|nr:hypothetical protein [Myxococcales bacterium]
MALILLFVGCGGQPANRVPTHAARARITTAIATLDKTAPLRLRYNPAPCACPLFEVRVGKRWLRAAWPGLRDEKWAGLAGKLAATSARQWPVELRVQGQVDAEVLRTRAGSYVVTIDVSELVAGGRLVQ